jgi:hypothetical protein
MCSGGYGDCAFLLKHYPAGAAEAFKLIGIQDIISNTCALGTVRIQSWKPMLLLLRAAPAEDPAALLHAERRGAMYLLFCRAAGAVPPAATRTEQCAGSAGSVRSWRRGVWAHEQGAEHSAEHGAVDDGDAVRKQQATILCGVAEERNDTVLLRCVVSFL